MSKRIDANSLAMENIRQRKTRSTCMILLVALFSLIVYMGSMFSLSLSRGLESLSDRLGADVIVVPAGYKAEIESVLLKGEPSTFYLPADTIDKLKKFNEIEKMTPQIYVATLSASCCSYPVQIIGIDIDTDFLIYPWITHNIDKELKDGEAIVGSHVIGEKGETVHFFNEELKIVGRLKQTGIGFDATVFVNQNTAKQLAKASERITANKVAEEDVISSVMIKAKPGVDSVKLASKISKELSKEGIFAMFSKKFVNSISSNLKVLSTSILVLVGAIWILSIVVLSISFTAIFNERKKEMAVLRVLGASKKMLREIILKEAVILSLWGAGIGSFLGVILSVAQLPLLASKFSMPFLSPSLLQYIGIFILSFVLGVIIGPLFAVKDVNLNILDGDFVHIIGRSGSGKSTLLNIVAGLLSADNGTLSLDGTNYLELNDEEKSKFRNKNIGFIPQSPALLGYLNILENIRLPYDMYEKDGDSEGKARYFLNELGLEHLAKSYPKELSGGELRRIIIARALMTEPRILIADEPTSDLDIEATKEVMDLLKKINEKGTSILIVTHELETLKYGKKVYTMSEGVLTEGRNL